MEATLEELDIPCPEEPVQAAESSSSSSSSDSDDSGLNGTYWNEVYWDEDTGHANLRPVRAPLRYTEEYADEIAEVYRKDAERRARKRRRGLSFGLDTVPPKAAVKAKPTPTAAVSRWKAFF